MGVGDVVVRPIFADEVGRFNAALTEHHWLGRRLTGQVLRYVAVLGGEWVAVAGFGSAVLSCRARDEFLGWSRAQQYARLRHVANNQRLCVLPAGRRPNLASAVLSRLLARLSGDYLAAYGHRVLAVETFTDPARHTGACYAAANFTQVGSTLGYSRSAGAYHHHGNPKRVWMYRLHRGVRGILSAPFPHPLLIGKDDHVADVNTLELGGQGGLLDALRGLSDPRSKRGIRHQIASTLTMVAAATISGCRSFRSVADYVADLPPEALTRLGARRHPVTGRPVAPSEATIRRTVKDVDADEADTIAGTWLHAKLQAGLVSPKAWRALALDGKTLKGSWEEIDTGAGKVRLFSALTHAEGVVVGQRRIPEHTGEQAQMIPRLDQIAGGQPPDSPAPGDLSGVVVTADALHVHRSNVEQILERNGEYVLTVKRNQPILRNSIKALFADADGDFPPHHVTFDRGHGREEIRSITTTAHVADLSFPGVYQAWAITREVSDLHGNPLRTRNETVYGITSLTASQANPTDVLDFNRGHWAIENREHYVRDVTFDEDRSQVRTGSSPQVMTAMRNIAISLLRLAGWTNIKQATEKMSRRLDQVLNLLGV